jgi:hypothetical protein
VGAEEQCFSTLRLRPKRSCAAGFTTARQLSVVETQQPEQGKMREIKKINFDPCRDAINRVSVQTRLIASLLLTFDS